MTNKAWSRELADWVAFMRSASLSENTISMRIYHLGRVAAEIGAPPAALAVSELTEWLSRQRWKPNTRRAYRASLRSFYHWSMVTGRVSSSPAHQLPAVRVPRARPRPLPEAEWEWCKRIVDERARLATMMAGGLGLRRGEVAGAQREDLEPDLVGWSLRVVGKGGHVRLVPVPDDLAEEIRRRPAGWLFPSSRTGDHLTPHHLGKIISRNLPDGMTTHNLRHRFGTAALEAAGGNLRVVQELLGHASPATTAIYTLPPDQRLRAAVEAVA